MSSLKNKQKGKKQAGREQTIPLPSERYNWISLVLLLVYVFIAFSPSLQNGFVDWDDGVYVFNNPAIKGLSLQHVIAIFTNHDTANYNPLTILSFAVDYHFYGLDPFGYHLVNILLHLVNVALVYFLIRSLGAGHMAGILVALLFGIHPLRVESVTWVTERKDVLFGFFYLFALISYVKFRVTKKVLWLVLLYLSFILSLLSKIQAVALPLTLLVIDYYMARPIRWKLVLEKIPLFLLSLVTGLAGIYFLKMQHSFDRADYTLIERMLMGCYAMVIYLVKGFVPFAMSAIYPYPKQSDFSFLYFLSPLIILLCCGLVIYSLRKTRIVAAGFLFFIFNIIFVLQVVNAGQGFLADRFTYIPYIGLCFVERLLVVRLVNSKPALRPYVIGAISAYVVILSVLTWNYAKVWENTETLFSHVLARYKHVSVALQNRARYYREHEEYDKSLADYTTAISINQDPSCYVNRGRLFFEKGNYDEAFTDFTQALLADTTRSLNYAAALLNRGAIFGMRKQYDSAIGDLTRSIGIKPGEKQAWLNLALVQFYNNNFSEAKKACDKYLFLKSDDVKMINFRGQCHEKLGNYKEALADYNMSLEMEPKKGDYYLNRSFLYSLMGDKEKAISDAQKAQSLGVKLEEGYLRGLVK
jgi:protein O-mannosyl-transferase